MNIIEGQLKLNGNEKFAIINARFNSFITDKLVEGAKDAFVRFGGNEKNLDLILVPGAFELPYALKQAVKKNYDGIVVLGAVIRGDTPHFDYVSAECTKGVAAITLANDTPISFGVLTTNTTEQAMDRAGIKSGNKGYEAMVTTIEMLNLQRVQNGN
ncbi:MULTISPECIES: 6,7-dimethyl-8-ribityllumazine synthase [unclassified Campylobacter]|uniref:6,7-dimethyl-8-ribityllumazine synthase n=1 Tax=unclassified Campylobacter TaxID=2593542 RepID=UPI001BDB5C01|nr:MULTISPECIES: 6,7-dimethyl-8-ribityllumazine synthase [unclassified Campylobacter]MBZ7976833.1 6,7-dimethyl-8-ribityllumazine synthase [Campylobacter sp. RM12637]MBZ7978603.1 6,7-dimethyl-8-ribityllumazine synthase [Campylobacter sp. RM12654]MBZ7980300.1 6,7-dimethyl-8-ribityllumazine synthase [Campylobacter sp. RM12642]MBZ7982415.1 6,7-dimethyl-8-ribityllumazine synthase [Campylobacter sp. RM12640]MBZ7984267.1 6,7-dimethyl-8-ribityllumazine synthase [Campylobacter sp. RM12647]MBZ7989597.1